MTKINFQGGIDEIKKQIEQTIATYELLGADSTVNFEQWYERWEKGLPDAIENRGLGNYPLNGEKAWRGKPENWPRFRQWSNKGGIVEGEYWRDRANESDSVPVAGAATQVINQIIQLEHQRVAQPSKQQITSDIIRYSGIPEITLHFKGIDKSNPQRPKVVEGEKSFRFMGYTDNPAMAQKRPDLELIKQTDIDRIAAKIKAIFGTSPVYSWSKGKKLVNYHDWSRGYNFNIYCSSHAEGDRLLAALLALRELEVDETFVKYGLAKNPVKAYPPANEIEVLGKKHKTDERLPSVDVTYQYATIYLPTLKETRHIA